MTNKEAIKFLQQLYPNGGHCWLDEQRIEAIGMAVKALQEEPISKDLEEAAKHYLYSNILYNDVYVGNPTDKDCIEMFKAGAQWQKTKDESTTEDLGEYLNELSKQFPEVSFAKLSRIAVRVANWQKEQMLKDAIETEVCERITQNGLLPSVTVLVNGFKVCDKVKVIVIKED